MNQEHMNTVVGLFEHRWAARSAMHRLRLYGIPRGQIHCVIREQVLRERLGGGCPSATVTVHRSAGAAGGGVLGALLGMLGGLSALPLPTIDSIPIALGAVLVAVAAGAGAGAAVGGLVGKQDGLRILPVAQQQLNQGLLRGVLVSVHASKLHADAAATIMRRANAVAVLAL